MGSCSVSYSHLTLKTPEQLKYNVVELAFHILEQTGGGARRWGGGLGVVEDGLGSDDENDAIMLMQNVDQEGRGTYASMTL